MRLITANVHVAKFTKRIHVCTTNVISLYLLQPEVEPGDVIIILQQKEHELFTREGNDLFCSYNLSLTEALCGFQFTLKHLDGRDLLIKSPPGVVINPGEIWHFFVNCDNFHDCWLFSLL